MSLLRDAVYLLAILLSAPIWMFRLLRTGKFRTDWLGRFGWGPFIPRQQANGATRPRILLHAVSLGEVNATRQLVESLAALPEKPDIVLASTTDTGIARAQSLFGSDHHIVRYPFDLSWAVHRFLNRTQPNVVVLMELEIWPTFAAVCRRRGIPLIIVNGRLSQQSFQRYRLIAMMVRRMFASVEVAAAQTEAYADRFRAIGVPADRVIVTDTMKWDTAQVADDVPGAAELAQRLGIDRSRPLVVAGSTAPGEHELLERAVPSDVQLLCAPRKPEWFNQAASVLNNCVRWSAQGADRTGGQPASSNRFLLDTIGELRHAYALADLVIIGRTFVPLGGSDMMEAVALGKATIIGPHTEHFQSTAEALLDGAGLVQVEAHELSATIAELLADPSRRADLAKNGREVIESRRGATTRHAELIREVLNRHSSSDQTPAAWTKLAVSAGSRDGEGGERRKKSVRRN